MAHVFDGKLYFTRDHMQGNFIPKNLKLPQPKPTAKPQAKASSSGEHVQLFLPRPPTGGHQRTTCGPVPSQCTAATPSRVILSHSPSAPHPSDVFSPLTPCPLPNARVPSLSRRCHRSGAPYPRLLGGVGPMVLTNVMHNPLP